MTTSLGSFVNHVTTYPANCNPFHHDSYRMGQRIAKDITMMFEQHQDEPLRGNLRFVEESTGLVVELDLSALFHHIQNAQENA